MKTLQPSGREVQVGFQPLVSALLCVYCSFIKELLLVGCYSWTADVYDRGNVAKPQNSNTHNTWHKHKACI